MRDLHAFCFEVAAEYGSPGNYVLGANIAAFSRVAGYARVPNDLIGRTDIPWPWSV